MAARIDYANGIKSGHGVSYWPNGRIAEDCTFVNGTLNGEYLGYSSRGNLSATGHYVDGMRSGVWLFYSTGETHDLLMKVTYLNGKAQAFTHDGQEFPAGSMVGDSCVELLKVSGFTP